MCDHLNNNYISTNIASNLEGTFLYSTYECIDCRETTIKTSKSGKGLTRQDIEEDDENLEWEF